MVAKAILTTLPQNIRDRQDQATRIKAIALGPNLEGDV
jgi:hypothetical protein